MDTENATNKVAEIGELIDLNEGYVEELNSAAGDIDKRKQEGFYILSELVKKTEESKEAAMQILMLLNGQMKGSKSAMLLHDKILHLKLIYLH